MNHHILKYYLRLRFHFFNNLNQKFWWLILPFWVGILQIFFTKILLNHTNIAMRTDNLRKIKLTW